MKIILTTDVDHLGVAGDVVEVKGGYARNYLLPNNRAITATPGALKQVEGIRRAKEARSIKDLEHALEVKRSLEGLTNVQVGVKTAQSGRLFGSVTHSDVASAIKTAGGPAVDKRAISFPQGHVKSLGDTKVKIELHPSVDVIVPVAIVANN